MYIIPYLPSDSIHRALELTSSQFHDFQVVTRHTQLKALGILLGISVKSRCITNVMARHYLFCLLLYMLMILIYSCSMYRSRVMDLYRDELICDYYYELEL